MMTLAPGTGKLWAMPSGLRGTWASHPSSCAASFVRAEEYHDPACVASRVVIVDGVGLDTVRGVERWANVELVLLGVREGAR